MDAEEQAIDELASRARDACGCEHCVGPQPSYGTSTPRRAPCWAVSVAFELSELSEPHTKAAAYRASEGWKP